MPVLDGIRILSKNFFHMSKAMLGGYRTPHRTGEPVLLP
jgi:hypothetical protein